jgi:putative hemolysin
LRPVATRGALWLAGAACLAAVASCACASHAESGAHVSTLPPWLLWTEAVVAALSLVAIAGESLAEAALVSCSPHLMRRLAEAGDPRARAVRALFADRGEDAVTFLVISVNAAILLLATLAGHLTVETIGARYYTATALGVLAFVLAVCEVTPKTYAAHHADEVALRVIRWVGPLARSLPARIIVGAVKGASWPVQRLLGVDELHRHLRVTDEELMSLADVAEEQDVLDATQAQMFESIVEFSNRAVREIMVPRIDIVSVDASASLPEIIEVVGTSGKSRVAVCRGPDDPVMGIVYANDVLACLYRGETERVAGDLARPAHMVPDTKNVDDLFREMRERHIHIALVIDEHGGVDGLVTMEDVLEEIVGDVRDEHDGSEKALIVQLEDGACLVQAGATRSELEDELGIELPEDVGDYDTLGGFLYQRTDQTPEPGFSTECGGIRYEIATMDGPRITEVLVTRLGEPENGDVRTDGR